MKNFAQVTFRPDEDLAGPNVVPRFSNQGSFSDVRICFPFLNDKIHPFLFFMLRTYDVLRIATRLWTWWLNKGTENECGFLHLKVHSSLLHAPKVVF